jgi:N-acyl-D-amino-acid deacylase
MMRVCLNLIITGKSQDIFSSLQNQQTHKPSNLPIKKHRLMIRNSLIITCLLILLSTCEKDLAPTILIQNATIIDGTDKASFEGAVRILNGQIIGVGDLKVLRSDSLIDAKGWVLSPGFIDTHSHHERDPERTVTSAISQGITTIVVGQDGGSLPDLQSYFDSISLQPLSLNVASYAGHNSIRRQVMGDDFKRRATEVEIKEMEALLAQEMEAGAIGLSTGLEYNPGIYSDTEEVLSLAKVAAAAGGRYISHMRSEDIALEESIQEILKIGQQAQMPVQISHFKLARKSLWGQADRILQTLDSARAAGIEVTADVYPYEYWQSTMTVLFPKRDFENRETAAFALTELTSPEGMIISRFNAKPEYENMTLAEIAALRSEDPVSTYLHLIALSQVTPGESIIAKSMDAADINTLLNWPHTNLCSDGGPTGHPRGWGAFPRYLKMDTGQSLANKIHKMTALAAQNLGFDRLGQIKEGFHADLVLFDPASVQDNATYEQSNLPATGIEMVFVSGQVVYQNQKPTQVYSGRVIKRQK